MWFSVCCFFFFNDTATTEIYTLSLHDALPIYEQVVLAAALGPVGGVGAGQLTPLFARTLTLSRLARDQSSRLLRSEEHTSELQSRQYLVCRLLLEKKKTTVWRVRPNSAVQLIA